MASSNRHWPSMFKSKPCNTTHHQWQHDINQSLLSTACQRPSYSSSGGGCEERSPEPKPRWNPKPEQIRILEAIFNSGMVNPPRDEIRKIRAQLQEYGQVGDANVFYWFQNRKSRSKHKLRHLSSKPQPPTPKTTPQNPTNKTPSSSSSSSSDKSSFSFSDVVSNSPTASVNQTFFHTTPHQDLFLFGPPPTSSSSSGGGGLCSFSELSNDDVVHAVSSTAVGGPCTSLLLSEIMNAHGAAGAAKRDLHLVDANKLSKISDSTPLLLNYNQTPPSSTRSVSAPSIAAAVPSPMNQIQGGVGEEEAVGPGSAAKSTVFINDVAFEVAAGPFNVREAFGDDAVLIHSSGHPVLTNDWGLTLHSLQHGAFYYLI